MTNQDIESIVAVHESWMYSNNGLEIDKMVPNFANPGYHQFNLNGFTYDLPEKVKLWEGLRGLGMELALVKIQEAFVHVEGDLAYLIDEWDVVIGGSGESGAMAATGERTRIRITEVFRRDDGKGVPEWKIWHFHCSYAAPADGVKYPQDA